MKRYGALTAVLSAVALVAAPTAAADVLAPSIASSAPAPPANDNNPVLNGTAAVGATVSIYADNPCTGTAVATGTADLVGGFGIGVSVADDSVTTFYAQASDATGTSPCSDGFTYTEDSTAPPAPDITAHPAASTTDTTASFGFSDAEAGVTFNCRLDSGAFPTCASPKEYTVTEGTHTFYVKATDAAGNESGVSSFTWTVDTTPPPPPSIDSHPPSLTNSQSASFTFHDSEVGTSFVCQLDDRAMSPCSSGVTYSGLDDGAHVFRVRAVDAPGNVSDPALYSWTIDATPPPEPTITAHPPDPSYSTAASFSFSLSGGSAQCRLDGGAFAACSSPKGYTLGDGSHTFYVRAVDGLGNASGPTTYSWTIVRPPAPTILTAPSDPSGSDSASFTFSDGDPQASLWCQLDGGSFSDCSAGTWSASGLRDGQHTFGVKAAHPVGHDSTVTTYTWTIDTVHPLVTITQKPPLLTNQTTASFSFAANHPGSTLQCRLDSGSDADFSPCASPQLYDDLKDGSHTFAVRAVSLGNVGIATEYTWTVDTVAPQTTITAAPPATTNNSTAAFAFASSEPSSTFSCSLDGSGSTLCASPRTYPDMKDGTHTFRVEAVDAAGNADASAAAYTWTIAGGGGQTDYTPPANVTRLRRSVGYGRLQLRWRKPGDNDFDHVEVYVSTSRKTSPRTLVYRGSGQTYTNKRFKNGLYYRYRIVSVDRSKLASKGLMTMVRPSVLLKSPRDGRVVHSPPVLRWTPVRKATFYNVQVYRLGEKILSAWPTKPRRVLAHRWAFSGRRFALRRGFYVWYVWPGFGPKAKSRYGQLLGQGTFKVR